MSVLAPAASRAQGGGADTTQAGTVAGRVLDEQGGPVAGAQVGIPAAAKNTRTRANGEYTLLNVPAGTQVVQVRYIGYRSQTAAVSVTTGERVTQDFRLVRDPLGLEAVVVTGTVIPRENLQASVAVTTLTPDIIEQAVPRSTTEFLRYVPGFTRVESSGGEVNQNITMRGILGVEYVMFMEDGLPVFPTMHTFWMNADNLFRPDENIDRVEVVRGGASALFGSSTPGAIMNIVNKTGGTDLTGSMKASAATGGLARYDFNVNGPLGGGEDWRFNLGGFYRYDHGVRDPGFPGVRGGQLKASVTRMLERGRITATVKMIDDRNQFILPLPFTSPGNYVSGFSEYGALNTNEANHVRVAIPTGELELPLDDGLRTKASWVTADASFDLGSGWNVQNTAQFMTDEQAFNAIFPGSPRTEQSWVADQIARLGLPADSPYELVYTNLRDPTGANLPFDNPNGLVSPSEQPHIEKPLTAFQNQLRLGKQFGPHSLSFGVYFANYTQTNRWFVPTLLMDVRDNPHLLDLTVFDPSGNPIRVTKNGYRNFLNNYVSGSGQTAIFSGVIGGAIQVTDRLRADLGVRYEYDNFVQTGENTAFRDLDGDPTTLYDNEKWGTGSFRHFDRNMDDWAASVGLNYRLTDQFSLYAQGSRAYKMPALDEFLESDPAKAALFDARETRTIEGGVKYASGYVGFAVNGFWGQLKNIVGQGLVDDPVTGGTRWITTTSPENRSYGAELEASVIPATGLTLLGNATILKAELSSGAGADIGSWLNGVPRFIGNLSGTYALPAAILRDLRLTADWHYVDRRFAAKADTATGFRPTLPSYNYFNFGTSYRVPGQGITIGADLLNAFQSTGLEEGNPRAALTGSTGGVFLARPLLPRRFLASLRYDF